MVSQAHNENAGNTSVFTLGRQDCNKTYRETPLLLLCCWRVAVHCNRPYLLAISLVP